MEKGVTFIMEKEIYLNTLIAYLGTLSSKYSKEMCIINGSFIKLSELEKMGYNEFSLRAKINMPLKLYKYFPCMEKIDENGNKVNYSIQALLDNTVYVQTPTLFDDPYDCDININFEEYQKLRLTEYCRRSAIKITDEQSVQEVGDIFVKHIYESILKYQNYDNIFAPSKDKGIQLTNELFINRLSIKLNTNVDIGKAVGEIITDEYNDLLKELKVMFRVACFTTNPFSQLMWGGQYANNHQGFCIEYTIDPNDEEYKDVYLNLFPVIYAKIRTNAAKQIITNDVDITEDELWSLYMNGILRKSIDWSYQNEWRLLSLNRKDFNIRFFPITKVYLGSRMSKEKRLEVIKICKEKNVPYIGVVKDNDYFEMKECNMKCENCIIHCN